MDQMGALQSYVYAVRTGSLSAAARRRKLSQPAVSQQISALEDYYDIRLLHRGRNGVRMTEAGEIVYKRALAILDEQESLQDELETFSGKISGKLTVTASLGLSQHVMGNVIVQLAKQYPELKILLRAEDRILDLDKENIDIALRFATPGSGGGIARKIAALDVLYVATPEYLDAAGRPSKPEQLANLDYIRYRANDEEKTAAMSRGSQIVQVPLKVGLTAQLPDLMFQALYAHLGYAKAPRFLVDEALNKGELEVLLAQWQIPATDLFLAYRKREVLSPRVIAFFKVLFNHLKLMRGAKLTASVRQMLQQPTFRDLP